MKRMLAFLMALCMALVLLACGAEKDGSASATTLPNDTSVVMEAPTEVFTEPIVGAETDPAPEPFDGTLRPYIPALGTSGDFESSLSVIDDETIGVQIYQRPLYRKADVELLAPGHTIVIEDVEYVIADIALNSRVVDDQSAGLACIITTDKRETITLEQEPGAYGWGDFYAHRPVNYAEVQVPTVLLNVNINDVSFLDLEGEEFIVHSGAELMEMLKASPEAFTQGHAGRYVIAMMDYGVVYQIMRVQ